jgi:hypothetical protein
LGRKSNHPDEAEKTLMPSWLFQSCGLFDQRFPSELLRIVRRVVELSLAMTLGFFVICLAVGGWILDFHQPERIDNSPGWRYSSEKKRLFKFPIQIRDASLEDALSETLHLSAKGLAALSWLK